MKTDFDSIYKRNLWNGAETRSGPGSSKAATEKLAKWLPKLMTEINATSILDVPCGESYWIPDLPVPVTRNFSFIASTQPSI